MNQIKIFISLILLIPICAEASPLPVHRLSAEEQRAEVLQNEIARRNPIARPLGEKVIRPYAEYEKAGFVIFDANFDYEAQTIKSSIAQSLPEDMHLVVLANDSDQARMAHGFFEQYIDEKRFHTVVTQGGSTFWARDVSPEPLFIGEEKSPTVGLIWTHHRGGHLWSQYVGQFFKVPVMESNYAYPGGNFLSDSHGNCFQVYGDRVSLPEEDLKALYGCKTVTTFRQTHGIGDVDEVLRIPKEGVALLDGPEHTETLEALGYKVYNLPRPSGNPYGTYANSLLVNGKVYVPIYGVREDQEAINLYKDQGLEVIPLYSNSLSGDGLGSIHCITMSYPWTDVNGFIRSLKAGS